MENQAPDTHEVSTQFCLGMSNRRAAPASTSYPGLTTALGFAFGFGERGLGSVYSQTYRAQSIAVGGSVYGLSRGRVMEGVWLAELDRFLALGRS